MTNKSQNKRLVEQEEFAFSTNYEICLPSNHVYPTNAHLPSLNVCSPRKCLTEDEVLRLNDYAFSELRQAEKSKSVYEAYSHLSQSLLIFIGLNTGLRIMEITHLWWGDFVMSVACVFVRNGKGSKSRYVYYRKEILEPIILKAHTIIQKWQDIPSGAKDWLFYSVRNKTTPYCERSLQVTFKRILEKLGIREYLSPHCLRHTFAVNFYMASNKDINLLKEQLGHSNVNTTQIYITTLMSSIIESTRNMYPQISTQTCIIEGEKV